MLRDMAATLGCKVDCAVFWQVREASAADCALKKGKIQFR
jgi:hypothetical protein